MRALDRVDVALRLEVVLTSQAEPRGGASGAAPNDAYEVVADSADRHRRDPPAYCEGLQLPAAFFIPM
jgi:hypothetical protein